ncbi:hypothetical protein [Gymnodinialimonas ulvae]|uniref:hypothetical protein n=1 Tax=Gymnodinialimonas ulvae TaxID=3126504 RepID=UPI0030B233FA
MLAVAMGVAGVALPDPGHGDQHRPAADAIWLAEGCLVVGGRAFETSLAGGFSEEDDLLLRQVYSSASHTCLFEARGFCDLPEADGACLSDLSVWLREVRSQITDGLPEAIEGGNRFAEGRYRRAMERARGEANPANCNQIADPAERERYCEVVSETVALEDAYDVWRLARRQGAVPLVGNEPVDLEYLR